MFAFLFKTIQLTIYCSLNLIRFLVTFLYTIKLVTPIAVALVIHQTMAGQGSPNPIKAIPNTFCLRRPINSSLIIVIFPAASLCLVLLRPNTNLFYYRSPGGPAPVLVVPCHKSFRFIVCKCFLCFLNIEFVHVLVMFGHSHMDVCTPSHRDHWSAVPVPLLMHRHVLEP